jgi:hypothetical protein
MKPGRILFLAIICASWLAGCSSNDRNALIGTWESVEGQPPAQITFDGAGTVGITPPGGSPIFGKYVLLAGDHVEFDLKTPWNGSKTHRERIELIANELILRDPTGAALRFRRTRGGRTY